MSASEGWDMVRALSTIRGLAAKATARRDEFARQVQALDTADAALFSQTMDALYADAKAGFWDALLAIWEAYPAIARDCAHYSKASSGWTFLHQAAYAGSEAAVRALIRLGAAPDAPDRDGTTAVRVARSRGHDALASSLARAAETATGLWVPPTDATHLPSSCLWSEARASRASRDMAVAYAGSTVHIRAGEPYYADSFGRVLVGWHGTTNPPQDMAGEPMTAEDDDAR